MAQTLGYIWKHRKQILEGLHNKYFLKQETQIIADDRLAICRANTCGHYDEKGVSEKAVVKGVESCGGCGCDLSVKVRCLSCSCYLTEIGLTPLWENLLTQEEEEQTQ